MELEIASSLELLKFAEKLADKIQSTEKKNLLRLECMNGLGYHATYFKIDGTFAKWVNGLTHGSLVIPADNVYDVKTVGYTPFPSTIHGNVMSDGQSLTIDLKPALKFDLFSIEVARKIDDEYVGSLVRARAPQEVFGDDKVRYNLSAQLKNPEGLQLGFSNIEIEEFPITARVHLAEKINTRVPDYVKELIGIESELLDGRQPYRNKRLRELDQKRVRLLRKLGKATLEEKIQDLAQLLADSNFIKYVQTIEDFKLDRCEKSTEFFKALGMFQLPKFMNVISRADLNLKKPAAKGTLIYDSAKFGDEIASMFRI